MPRIENVRFTPGRGRDRDTGLLGYLTLEYGDLVLDGITLRRTADGRRVLSWPARRSRSGRDHAIVRPRDPRARRAIEQEIFREIGLVESVSGAIRSKDVPTLSAEE